MSGIFTCDLCGVVFGSETGVRKHVLREHSAVYVRGGRSRPVSGEELEYRLDALRAGQGSKMRRAVARAAAAVAGPLAAQVGDGVATRAAEPPAAARCGMCTVAGSAPTMASGFEIDWPDDEAMAAAVALDDAGWPLPIPTTRDAGVGDSLEVADVAVQARGPCRDVGAQAIPGDGPWLAPPPGGVSVATVAATALRHGGSSIDDIVTTLYDGRRRPTYAPLSVARGYVAAAALGQRLLARYVLREVASTTPEDCPAMLARLTAFLREIADRPIDNEGCLAPSAEEDY